MEKTDNRPQPARKGAATGAAAPLPHEGGIECQLMYMQQRLKAPKDETNSEKGFRYRTLEAILAAAKPLLEETRCTLTFSEELRSIGDHAYICSTARLRNAAGECREATSFAREDERLPGMCGAQISGACVSYARKYAAGGLFAIDGTRLAEPLEIDSLTPSAVEDWAGGHVPTPSPVLTPERPRRRTLRCGQQDGWDDEVARVNAWEGSTEAFLEDLRTRWQIDDNDAIVLLAARTKPFNN